MQGFSNLWGQCTSISTPVSQADFKQWLNSDFIPFVNTPSKYGCASYSMRCPVQNVFPSSFAGTYRRQRRLLDGDCCSEDDDCALGLHCDRKHRTCARQCTDDVFCPLIPSSHVTWSVYPKVGFANPSSKCSKSKADYAKIPIPRVTLTQ